MSGSKNTTTSIDDGAEVIGAALLAALAIPVGAAVLAYYAGKILVKGTIAGAQMAAQGFERFQEYQREQFEIHQQQLEDRRIAACQNLQTQINHAITYCNRVSSLPFMNNPQTTQYCSTVRSIAKQFRMNLDLAKAVALNQALKKTIKAIKTQENIAISCQQDQRNLLSQTDQIQKMIQSQPDASLTPELDRLEDYRNRINSSTLETFPLIKAEFSSWSIALMSQIKSVKESVRVKNIVKSLWNSLPVSQELAQKYDPSGYPELKRIESFVLASAQTEELIRFRKAFEQHKNVVTVKMRQEAEQEAKNAVIRKSFEPKLDELAQRLELADNELVKRWECSKLAKLKQSLKSLKTKLEKGDFQTMELDINAWNNAYTSMIEEAGLKQKAEERRQYLVEAMKTELPKLGFDIKSIVSNSDTTSDTIIKVVPHQQNYGQQITIAVPHADNKPVNYKFDGYNVKKSRVEGRRVEENDTGKQTVMDIAAALKPYGISMSEPDWLGKPENPDKIRKDADQLPLDNNPAETLDFRFGVQNRTLEQDY